MSFIGALRRGSLVVPTKWLPADVEDAVQEIGLSHLRSLSGSEVAPRSPPGWTPRPVIPVWTCERDERTLRYASGRWRNSYLVPGAAQVNTQSARVNSSDRSMEKS